MRPAAVACLCVYVMFGSTLGSTLSGAGGRTARQVSPAGLAGEDVNEPAEIIRQLDARFAVDPVDCTSLALKLASQDTVDARRLFVHWIHTSVALVFAPRVQSEAFAEKARVLLERLAQSPGTFAATVTEALRMWAEAQRTENANELIRFARMTFDNPLAFGPRYQLLLSRRLDQLAAPSPESANPDSGAEADALRRRIARPLEQASMRPELTEFEEDRFRYWLGFCGVLASDSLKAKGRPFWFQPIAEAAPLSRPHGVQVRTPAWFEEQRALGGPREYYSAYARGFEELGLMAEACRTWAEAASQDPDRDSELERIYRRCYGEEGFDAFWISARFIGGPYLPPCVLQTTAEPPAEVRLPSGRWTLLLIWRPSAASEPGLRALVALELKQPGSVVVATPPGTDVEVHTYLAHNRLPFPVVQMPDAFWSIVGPVVAPSYFIVRPDGRFVGVLAEEWELEWRRIVGVVTKAR